MFIFLYISINSIIFFYKYLLKITTSLSFSGTTAVADIQDIVRTIRNRGQFKGLGGELMKQACSTLIKKCSIVHFPVHFTDIVGTY